MKLNSKIVAGFLAASGVAFGIAAHAQAPGAACEHMGPGMMMGERMKMMGDPAARAEQHLSQFKSQLKINAQQEPLWLAFAEKAKAAAGQGMKAMREKAAEPMTAPERMSRMTGIMKERVVAMESVSESFARLYEALTPEQKTIADKQPGILGGHAPMRGPGGRPGAAKPQG